MEPPRTPDPEVSVIVTWSPDTNPSSAGPTLGSLERQDVEGRVEVLIVPPRDHSVPEPPSGATVLPPHEGTVADGRNVGLAAARGQHVLFLDPGTELPTDALRRLLQRADAIDVPALVGESERASLTDGQGADTVPVHRSVAACRTVSGKLYPRDWLTGLRFDPDSLDPDLLFNVRLHTPFVRRFCSYRLVPVPADGRPIAGPGPEDHPPERVAREIARLTSGTQRHPGDRAPIVQLVVEHYSVFLTPRQAAAADPTRSSGYAPAYHAGPVRRRLLLLAGSARSLNLLRRQVTFLRSAGVQVSTVWHHGTLGPAFRRTQNLQLSTVADPVGTTARARTGALRKLQRLRTSAVRAAQAAAPHLRPAATAIRLAATRQRSELAALAAGADVVAVDAAGTDIGGHAGLTVRPTDALHVMVLEAAAASADLTGRQAEAVATSAQELATARAAVPSHLWVLTAWRLVRKVHLAEARTVVASARQAGNPSAELDLVEHIAQAIESASLRPEDVSEVAGQVMDAADRALAEGDVDHAAFLASAVLELLLNPEATTNVAAPPVLADPEALFAPLRRSRTWQLLTGPVEHPVTDAPTGRAGARPRVLLLPGAYPRFWRIVANALEGHADVDVLQLASIRPALASTGPDPRIVRERLQASLGTLPEAPADVREQLAAADVVFADWADKGAVLASLFVPPTARLVVRLHGVDLLSPWQHLLDWSRVTDAIFVSEHMRRAAQSVLGEQIAHVRCHVIGNGVDFDRFTPEHKGATAHRTLGLVGWAQKVKDPIWALEVLALLRRHDPQWRLKLIGADFPARPRRLSEHRYAQEFRARALEPDVVGAVSYVGYTTNLPAHLSDVGFALSSSLRESWHVGAVEMVAAQAVPVFRNWPAFRHLDAVGELFGPECAVDTPQEAAERILASADRDVWERESAAARERFRQRFDPRTLEDSYRAVVLGEA